MTKSYFWNMVRAKGPVGSPRDTDRTTIPFSEHETVLSRVMFSGDLPFNIERSQCAEDGGPDDDEGSTVSRDTCDESIFERDNDERVHRNGNEEDDELYSALTDEERDLFLKKNLKALHLVKKLVHQHATTDLFVTGKQRLKKVEIARYDAIRKWARKRELIYLAINYFSKQMDARKNVLEASLLRSADKTTVYRVPSWKREYREWRSKNNMN
jgi:hypothetical protein